MVGYRLIQNISIVWPRSFCPHCNHTIYWYDNIPLLSWLLLAARCRFCKQPISFLYPFIELLTALCCFQLYTHFPAAYFIPYFIFFSALIVIIRSDIETMLISPLTTLYLIPFAFVCAVTGYLPIAFIESLLGAASGYLLLWTLSYFYTRYKGIQGIGEGDFDLLALIGSFTGILGWVAALAIGSILGSVVGIIYALYRKQSLQTALPFGPFLAIGAIIYVLYQSSLVSLLTI